jgi:hypothetical protein
MSPVTRHDDQQAPRGVRIAQTVAMDSLGCGTQDYGGRHTGSSHCEQS